MERHVQERAARALFNSSNPEDLPKPVIDFYNSMLESYYGMTSANKFSQREEGIVIGLGIKFKALNERIAKLEKKDVPVAVKSVVVDTGENKKNGSTKRKPGRPRLTEQEKSDRAAKSKVAVPA